MHTTKVPQILGSRLDLRPIEFGKEFSLGEIAKGFEGYEGFTLCSSPIPLPPKNSETTRATSGINWYRVNGYGGVLAVTFDEFHRGEGDTSIERYFLAKGSYHSGSEDGFSGIKGIWENFARDKEGALWTSMEAP